MKLYLSFITSRRGLISGLLALPLLKLIGCARSSYPPYPEHIGKDGVLYSDTYEVNHWRVQARKQLAKSVPSLGMSTCDSCGLPWWVVDGHSVQYTADRGCFPICEMCWHDLGSMEALPFYEDFIRKNYPGDEEKLSAVRKAIMGGMQWQLGPSLPPENPKPVPGRNRT